jgi:hypothetical protein
VISSAGVPRASFIDQRLKRIAATLPRTRRQQVQDFRLSACCADAKIKPREKVPQRLADADGKQRRFKKSN